MLSNLDKILTKAEADAETRKIDPQVFVNGRLAPDMFAADAPGADHDATRPRARRAPRRRRGRRSGRTTEKTSRTCMRASRRRSRHLKTFKPEQFEGAENATIELKFPQRDVRLHGQRLLLELRGAELLFPLHDGIRDPAPQRRADRQGRLPRQRLETRSTRRARWSTATSAEPASRSARSASAP